MQFGHGQTDYEAQAGRSQLSLLLLLFIFVWSCWFTWIRLLMLSSLLAEINEAALLMPGKPISQITSSSTVLVWWELLCLDCHSQIAQVEYQGQTISTRIIESKFLINTDWSWKFHFSQFLLHAHWAAHQSRKTWKKWEMKTWNLGQIFEIKLWMVGQ